MEDVLDLAVFPSRQPIDLSPDGKLVAAAIVHPSAATEQERYTRYFTRSGVSDQTLGATIRLIDVESGNTLSLTPEGTNSWSPSWSPDGRQLAFFSDRDGTAGLWVWDRTREEHRRVTDSMVRTHFGFETPGWCGGSDRILLKILPAGMTLPDLALLVPGGELTDRDDEERRGGRVPVTVLVSDSSLLTSPLPDTTATGDGWRSTAGPAVSWTNSALSDLVLVDASTGRIHPVARQVKPRGYRCSPDGRRVFFSDMRVHQPAGGIGTVVYSLVVVEVDGGEEHVVATDAMRDYGLTASWGPEGRRIAWVDADGALVVTGSEDAGGSPARWRTLGRFSREGVTFRTDYRPPLWSADGRFVWLLASDTLWRADLAADQLSPIAAPPAHQILDVVGDVESGRITDAPGGSVLLVVRDRRTQRMGFARTRPDGTETEMLWDDHAYIGPDFPYHVDVEGERVVFVAQTASHPQEIWVSENGLRTAEPRSDLHPNVNRLTLGESRLIEWTSARGETLRGPLVLPPDHESGRAHPLIVYVYPDDRPAPWVNRFGVLGTGAYNFQLLASRGYAVFYPEAPFEPGRPVDGLAEAILPGVDRLVELGLADPDRIGVTGTSAGGYATLALLVRSDRWRAAVAEQGFSRLLAYYTHSAGYVEGYGLGMGSPWEEGRLQAYIEQSPFFELDRVAAPVLLIHGDADAVVPVALSEQTFVALRRLGKPAALAIYHGEEHGMGAWRRANIEDYWERVWRWWDRWLGDN